MNDERQNSEMQSNGAEHNASQTHGERNASPAQAERNADALLNFALARYAEEPRPGLENRMLARLRSQSEDLRPAFAFFTRRGWLGRSMAFGGAGAAVVALLMLGMLVGEHRKDVEWQQRLNNAPVVNNAVRPVGAATVAPTACEAPSAAPALTVHQHSAQPAFRFVRHAGQFPTPAPLTPQERALARLAATADPGTLQALAKPMAQPVTNDAPLTPAGSDAPPPR